MIQLRQRQQRSKATAHIGVGSWVDNGELVGRVDAETKRITRLEPCKRGQTAQWVMNALITAQLSFRAHLEAVLVRQRRGIRLRADNIASALCPPH